MNYPAIHNLSPDIYSQVMSTIQTDSGWEVVNDNPIALNWSMSWFMKNDDVIDEEKKAEDAAEERFFPKFDRPHIPSPIAPKINSTTVSGNNAWNDCQTPYVTIINKKPVGTEDLNKYIGLPLEAKKLLSDVHGYTEVSEIFLPQSATTSLSQDELQELKSLLHSGVILP